MTEHLAFIFSQCAMWAACLFSVALSWRSIRAIRTNRALRQIILAYEKELYERGVSLPPRCVFCCQILPRHVEGCDFEDIYAEHNRIVAILTRPPIKYYPKGTEPPTLEGK
jgi:hypothetical protein